MRSLEIQAIGDPSDGAGELHRATVGRPAKLFGDGRPIRSVITHLGDPKFFGGQAAANLCQKFSVARDLTWRPHH